VCVCVRMCVLSVEIVYQGVRETDVKVVYFHKFPNFRCFSNDAYNLFLFILFVDPYVLPFTDMR